MRTRVKICGITRAEDAQAAVQAGADAIGLVFYPASARCVDIPQARAVCQALSPLVSVVALFVNAERDRIEATLAALPIDLLQFHGDESRADCEGFRCPYIKALAIRPGHDPLVEMRSHRHAGGFLLDAYQPHSRGGGGEVFDWSQVPSAGDRPLILAGGLTAGNVAAAITQVGPYAVDVSSGVEQRKGIKSMAKMQAFMRGVQRGDASRARS